MWRSRAGGRCVVSTAVRPCRQPLCAAQLAIHHNSTTARGACSAASPNLAALPTLHARSVCHSATVFANSLMHCGTTVDTFLRENLEWLKKATNWAKFSATAGQHLLNGFPYVGFGIWWFCEGHHELSQVQRHRGWVAGRGKGVCCAACTLPAPGSAESLRTSAACLPGRVCLASLSRPGRDWLRQRVPSVHTTCPCSPHTSHAYPPPPANHRGCTGQLPHMQAWA